MRGACAMRRDRGEQDREHRREQGNRRAPHGGDATAHPAQTWSASSLRRLRGAAPIPHDQPGLAVPAGPLHPDRHRLELVHAGAVATFFASALGVIPTAALMGRATEELAVRSGPGDRRPAERHLRQRAELIIALFALGAGLHEVVKASIIGSIMGNILLVLGAAMFFGGLGRDRQYFDRTAASAQSSMLLLAAAALVMPAIYELVDGQRAAAAGRRARALRQHGPGAVGRGGERADRLLRRRPVVLAEDPSRPLQPRDRRRGARRAVDACASRSSCSRIAGVAVGVMSEILVGSISEAARAARAQRVLHRRHRRGDRRQRRRALGRGARGHARTRWTSR